MADDMMLARITDLRVQRLLTKRDEGDWYAADLEAGQLLARQDRGVHITDLSEQSEDGGWGVNLCIGGCEDEADPCDSQVEYGYGADLETAWRYALGAMFGPDDEGYDEERLRALLVTMLDPPPDDMNRSEVEKWLST